MLYFYYIGNVSVQNYKHRIPKYILHKIEEFASTSITLNQNHQRFVQHWFPLHTVVLVQLVASTKTMLFLIEHVNFLEFGAYPMEKPQFSLSV